MKKLSMIVAVSTILSVGAWRVSNSPTSALPYYRSANLAPEWLSDNVANDSMFHHVSLFALRDQHNNIVSDRSFTGNATVIHFFFTQCGGVCPTTQMNLARMLSTFPDGARVQILSHSVTPERDSVAALQAYAQVHDMRDPRWHLLTGQRSEIETLARNSYFVNLNDGKTYGVNDLAHTETLALVDGRGRIRGLYTGTLRLDIDKLAEDIRTLQREQN